MPGMLLFDLGEKSGGKVEASRGSGGRKAIFGIDSLVVTLVCKHFFDVWWGGHDADLSQNLG